MPKVVSIAAALVAFAVFLCPCTLIGQTDDPFSIRVQADQVLVRAQVFHKGFRSATADAFYESCMEQSHKLLNNLPMSQPCIAEKDCIRDLEVNNLEPKDFHITEDGVEQKIDSVVLERAPWTIERQIHNDFIEFHKVWSHTPRGIWRASGMMPDWRFSAEYAYRIAYKPPKLEPGSCHNVKVTVDRRRTEVFSTDSYCYIEHPATDPLMGTEFGKKLEAELRSDRQPMIPLSVQAGWFYTDDHAAKLDIVLTFPPSELKHEWVEGVTRASVGVLGFAYTSMGAVAARFSDSAIVPGDLPWSQKAIADLPREYETQIDLAPGRYELRIVLGDGANFGRVVLPVTIEAYDGNELALSSLFLFQRLSVASVAKQEAAKVNLAPEYMPLVSEDNEVTPTTDPTFKPKKVVPVYFEVYEPVLALQPELRVQVRMRFVDPKGEAKVNLPWFDATPYRRPGKDTFAIIKFIYSDLLIKGEYLLEVQAMDSIGHTTTWRRTYVNIDPGWKEPPLWR